MQLSYWIFHGERLYISCFKKQHNWTMAHAPETSLSTLLNHLDEAYRLAQLLHPNPQQAAQLLMAIYQEAAETPPEPSQARRWLIERLLRRQRLPEAAATQSGAAFYQEVAESLLSHALPAALALLSTEERLWLYLCDRMGLSTEEAASLLDQSQTGYTQAQAALQAALRRILTPGQYALLEFGLSEALLKTHLQQTLARLLPPPPTSLRTEITQRLHQPRPATPALPLRHPMRHPALRALVAVGVVLLAGLLGWAAWLSTRPSETTPPSLRTTDLIQRSIQTTTSLRIVHLFSQATDAERYLQETLAWRVTVPDIAGAYLQGIALARIVAGLEVPVLIFEDRITSKTLWIYLYTYALLDRYRDRLHLNPDVLRQIEAEQHFDLHILGRQQVLIWRYRDDIYVAITEGDAAALRERIAFPS
jgi:hypothetical protein